MCCNTIHIKRQLGSKLKPNIKNRLSFVIKKMLYFQISKIEVHLPYHCSSFSCISTANPKSASLTIAPFSLLASSKFSGCKTKNIQLQNKTLHTEQSFKVFRYTLRQWFPTGMPFAFR